jgi:hypothetical protein
MRRLIIVILLLASLYSEGQIINASPAYRPFITTPVQADTALLTHTPSNSTRCDYGNYVGFKFVTPVSGPPMKITALGRWVVSGNTASHTVKLVDNSNNIIASATVNTNGQPVGYLYASITPVTLSANTIYHLMSLETVNGDSWHDGHTVTHTGIVTGIVSSYQSGSSLLTWANGQSYVPTNLKYYR